MNDKEIILQALNQMYDEAWDNGFDAGIEIVIKAASRAFELEKSESGEDFLKTLRWLVKNERRNKIRPKNGRMDVKTSEN